MLTIEWLPNALRAVKQLSRRLSDKPYLSYLSASISVSIATMATMLYGSTQAIQLTNEFNAVFVLNVTD